MSKGWSAFDGLPTPSFLDDTSAGIGSSFGNGNNGVILIPAGNCPSRSPASVTVPGPEERFLKPIAENKHPNTLYSSPINSPHPSPHPSPQRPSHSQSPHSGHAQHRPIGPSLGAFQPLDPPRPLRQPVFHAGQGEGGSNSSPITPRQDGLYPRADFYGSPARSVQQSPSASASSPANHSPNGPPHPHLSNSPSLQNFHAMQAMHSPFMGAGDHGPVRFTGLPPHAQAQMLSGSPSQHHPQTHSAPASPFRAQAYPSRRELLAHPDDGMARTAEMLGNMQLDSPGQHGMAVATAAAAAQLQQQRSAVRPGAGSPASAAMGNLFFQLSDMPPKGYKTVICKFWENNMCTKGATCTFAHGVDDLKRFAGAYIKKNEFVILFS
jgi:hypothetical protein